MQIDEDGRFFTTSEEIAKQTRQFKAKGGRVQKIPNSLPTVESIKKTYDPKGKSYTED